MKRAISFLATLMLAFVVAFGFVVNSASADVLQCKAKVTRTTPCTMDFKTGDVITFMNNAGANLSFDVVNYDPMNTGAFVVTLGSQAQPLEVVQSGGSVQTKYATSFVTGKIENQSAVSGVALNVNIVSTL